MKAKPNVFYKEKISKVPQIHNLELLNPQLAGCVCRRRAHKSFEGNNLKAVNC